MAPTPGDVASPHHMATRAGRRALQDGGSAVDAALAAAAVLTVVYPHMNALGGDAQALLALPDGTVRAYSGAGAAARSASAAALGGPAAAMPIHGVHPVTVPGLIDTWAALHAKAGRLPWAALFHEAIALAEGGVPVAAALGRDLVALHQRLALDSGLRGVFFGGNGRVLQTGEMLRQPALARSLQALAQRGAREFYEGALGAAWVSGLRALGSQLQVADLASHRGEWLEPLAGRLGQLEVLTTPPLSQGYVLLQLIGAVEHLGLQSADPLGEAAPVLAHLCAATAAERDRVLGDPRHVEVDLGELLSGAHVAALADAATRCAAPPPVSPPQPQPDGDTVAIVAQDGEGHAVTLIQSIFHAFGAGLLEPATGIVCHNRGAAFTLHDGPALMVGGRRPPTTLTPSLIRCGGRIESALGCMGGKSQPQVLLQVLLRLLAGNAPAQALSAPRWVVGSFGPAMETVVLAEGAVPEASLQRLAATGLPVLVGEMRDDRAGHAQFVWRTDEGIGSATDPRSDGADAGSP